MRGPLVAVVVTLALAAMAPTASAASCSVGDSGITSNRDGERARFRDLQAMNGMNCRSARYVLNRWLRPAYARGYSARIPTDFYDGYVDWSCHKLSRLRWQCDEYDSYTSFRFTAYTLRRGHDR
jgi:hypothetical protein